MVGDCVGVGPLEAPETWLVCRDCRGGRRPMALSPSPPGLTLDEPVGVKESEEGSKEERVGLAATPSTGWPHPR